MSWIQPILTFFFDSSGVCNHCRENHYLRKSDSPKRKLNGICRPLPTKLKVMAKAYSREYGVNPDVVMSLPDPVDLSPSVTDFGKIRIIHHGNANPARQIELMIEMMDYVDEGFCLDLMLVPVGSRTYYSKLKEMASKRNNVAVISPTSFENIIRRINQYDIGYWPICRDEENRPEARLRSCLEEFRQKKLGRRN